MQLSMYWKNNTNSVVNSEVNSVTTLSFACIYLYITFVSHKLSCSSYYHAMSYFSKSIRKIYHQLYLNWQIVEEIIIINMNKFIKFNILKYIWMHDINYNFWGSLSDSWIWARTTNKVKCICLHGDMNTPLPIIPYIISCLFTWLVYNYS